MRSVPVSFILRLAVLAKHGLNLDPILFHRGGGGNRPKYCGRHYSKNSTVNAKNGMGVDQLRHTSLPEWRHQRQRKRDNTH